MSSTSSARPNLTRGYQIALSCAVILSTTGIFTRYLTVAYHLPTLVLAFWRDAFTALTLLPVLALRFPALLRAESRHLPYFLVYGFVLAIFNTLWTLSVAQNGAAVATVLVYSSGAFTALLGWWFLKESVGPAKILAVALSLAGCLLVSGASNPSAWTANLTGILTGIISGFSYAVYSLMGRSASGKGLNPWTTLFYTFGFASLFLFLGNLLPNGFLPGIAAGPAGLLWLKDALDGWGVLFLLAAGPTLVGFGLYNVSMVYLPASTANLIVTLEPVFTALIAWFFLGERLTGMQFLGGLMTLSGVALLTLRQTSVAKMGNHSAT